MKNGIGLIVALVLASSTLSGCAPLIIGAAGVVIADEALERKRGGDGLF